MSDTETIIACGKRVTDQQVCGRPIHLEPPPPSAHRMNPHVAEAIDRADDAPLAVGAWVCEAGHVVGYWFDGGQLDIGVVSD